MRKKFLTFLIILLTITNLFAKDYYSDFVSAIRKNDIKTAEKTLKEWERKEKNNDQILLCYFNLYVQQALLNPVPDTFVVLTSKDGSQDVQEMKIPDPELVKKGTAYIDKFLEKNPNRLDAYSGKREILMEAKLYDEIIKSIKQMLETSISNNNEWYWENGPYENGEEGLFIELETTLLGFQKKGFNETSNYIKEIVDEEQKYYSESAWINEHAGMYYAAMGDFEKAIFYFEKSYTKEPSYTNLITLAKIYENELNNKTKAIEYYEKMKLLNDDRITFEAERNIERLKK